MLWKNDASSRKEDFSGSAVCCCIHGWNPLEMDTVEKWCLEVCSLGLLAGLVSGRKSLWGAPLGCQLFPPSAVVFLKMQVEGGSLQGIQKKKHIPFLSASISFHSSPLLCFLRLLRSVWRSWSVMRGLIFRCCQVSHLVPPSPFIFFPSFKNAFFQFLSSISVSCELSHGVFRESFTGFCLVWKSCVREYKFVLNYRTWFESSF